MAESIRGKPKVPGNAESRTPLRGIAAVVQGGWREVLMRVEQGYTLKPAEMSAMIRQCYGVPGYAAEYVARWVEATAGPKLGGGRPRLSQSDPRRNAEDVRLENEVRWLQAALRRRGVAAHKAGAVKIVAKREGMAPTKLCNRLKSVRSRDSGLHHLPPVDTYMWVLGELEEARLVRLDERKGVVSVPGNQIVHPAHGLELLNQLVGPVDPP
jgi:hypothetical protein